MDPDGFTASAPQVAMFREYFKGLFAARAESANSTL
jgi:hypothetical protein